MCSPSPQKEAAVIAGGVTPKFPARALTWETKGRDTVTQTLEHEEQDEAVSAPVAPEEPTDEEQEADDAHERETAGDEPAEGRSSGPQSEREVKALGKKLDAERERHAKKLGDILGDASTDTLPCPLCFEALMGFVLPGDAMSLPDDQRAAALSFLGQEIGGGMPQTPGTETCSNCDGYGETANPTKAPHYTTSQCAPCGGQGYIKHAQPPPQLASVPHVVTAADAQANGVVGPCSRCGAPNSEGRPHFCNPVAQGVT